jgi:hypothetical protein
LALARKAIEDKLRLKSLPELTDIRSVAGGWLAIRFVCVAHFVHPDVIDQVAGFKTLDVQYSSELMMPSWKQRVSISLEPDLEWSKVQ